MPAAISNEIFLTVFPDGSISSLINIPLYSVEISNSNSLRKGVKPGTYLLKLYNGYDIELQIENL